jgi:hypothetical protein
MSMLRYARHNEKYCTETSGAQMLLVVIVNNKETHCVIVQWDVSLNPKTYTI